MSGALAAELDGAGASQALSGARRLIDPAIGIVGALREVPPPIDEPDVACVSAAGTDAARASLFGHEASLLLNSSGTGLLRTCAAVRAVGEVLERYAASFPGRHLLTTATWRDLGGPHPEEYALFSPEQWASGLPYSRFEEDTPIEWVPADDLTSGRTVWVPAQRVFLVRPRSSWRAEIGPATSTGLACATSRTGAVLAGVLEAVERDAFAITWWRKLPAAPIGPSAGGSLSAVIASRFRRCGLDFVTRLLPTDLGIPTVLALALDRSAPDSVAAVGAAARLDPAAAYIKALLEAVQTRTWLRQMGGGVGFDPGPGFDGVRQYRHHVQLFGKPQSLPHLDFLLDSKADALCLDRLPDVSGKPEADLAYCVERLRLAGLRLLVVDLTPPELEACGFNVVKVVVPGLVDVAPSHRHRFVGGLRLREVPARIGVGAADGLNDYPHPFP